MKTSFLEELYNDVKRMRDITAERCCEDMLLSDGTVIYHKEQGEESVRNYDDLLKTIELQMHKGPSIKLVM